MTKRQSHDNKIDTLLTHAGRHPEDNHGIVNPPVYHASTILFPNTKELLNPSQKYRYGRRGTPTIDAMREVLIELEGAEEAFLAPSGLAAISIAMLSCLSAGDHVLVADTVYSPNRHLCDTVLARMGVTTTYYDPRIGGDIDALFTENTRAVFVESPGSMTFELQDIDAIAAVAHAHDAIVLMDNTWATPVFYRPMDHGVDVSIMAGTKYVIGHSDAMFGTIAANERAASKIADTYGALGQCVGPDDIYLALRGIRTMGVRLRQHMESGLKIARWLETRPEVDTVFHPGLESHPDHGLWKRDFNGASGLFSVSLKPGRDEAVHELLDGLQLFGRGYSWGGFESLAVWSQWKRSRTATSPDIPGPLIRLHVGLEDVDDLQDDLAKGLDQYNANL